MRENRCVSCGAIIPEGRQVCPLCENTSVRRGHIEVEDREDEYCVICKKQCKSVLFFSTRTQGTGVIVCPECLEEAARIQRASLKKARKHHR